jgi:hypothetical protein
MNTLHFTPADLEANREGRLSDAQRKKLDADVENIRKYSRYIIPVFALAIALLIGMGLAPESSSTLQDDTWLSSRVRGGNLLMAGITLALCFLVTLAWNWWSLRRYEQGHLLSVEGKAQVTSGFVWSRGRRYILHQVRIWRGWMRWTSFRFQDADSVRYFKTGRRYRVYYLWYYAQPQAISVEEIADEKDKR